MAVTLNGSPQTAGTHYTQPDVATVLFAAPPPASAHIVMTYSRQLFQTLELESYLAVASEDHDRQVERVYRAGILAVDSLLIGTATALSFGAAGSKADMPSVFDRLATLRAAFAAALAGEAARPRVIQPIDPVPLLPP